MGFSNTVQNIWYIVTAPAALAIVYYLRKLQQQHQVLIEHQQQTLYTSAPGSLLHILNGIKEHLHYLQNSVYRIAQPPRGARGTPEVPPEASPHGRSGENGQYDEKKGR